MEHYEHFISSLTVKERMEMNDDDYAHYFSKQEESPEFDSLYGSI